MAEGPKLQMPARRKARKRALDVLYEADLRDLPPRQVLATYLERIAKPHPDHLAYAISLVEEPDDVLAAHLRGVQEVQGAFAGAGASGHRVSS